MRMTTTKTKQSKVTSWAGVDPLCVVCGKPASVRWVKDGAVMSAACGKHYAEAKQANADVSGGASIQRTE